MNDLHTLGLIDGDGQPFDGRITKVLHQIAPRLRREFPALEDDVAVTEVLEEAGRRIVQCEVEAWTARAAVWLRVGDDPERRAHASDEPGSLRPRVSRREAKSSSCGSSRRRARPSRSSGICLLKELLSNLSEEEQEVILFKKLGLSTAEIAERQQRSPGAVDVLFFRIKQKFRDLLAPNDASGTATAASPATRTASASSRRPAPSPEASDAPARSLPGRRRGWR